MTGLENSMNIGFTARLAIKEKQIQQNYRPVIGIHKWFARRPGTVFRSLLLAEFYGNVAEGYFQKHHFDGLIADPFMGGGTPTFEANRLGFGVVAADVNPMAYWIVKRALENIDLEKFKNLADLVCRATESKTGHYFETQDPTGQMRPVKYFIWVMQHECPQCGTSNDLFPGYLLAENVRHPYNIVACCKCLTLNEVVNRDSLGDCKECQTPLRLDGPARNNKVKCKNCEHTFRYPAEDLQAPPRRRLWALEYHCKDLKGQGRFFKSPDEKDLELLKMAEVQFDHERFELPIPQDKIPEGDETKRLHRWGLHYFKDMFSKRQLLTLGTLANEIKGLKDCPEKDALITVFSDFLRYQNSLCRYDTYALKCQDIFSVHGFPVSLIHCENNVTGIPNVGSGAFRHFVNKYTKAKEYCQAPFETIENGKGKKLIPILGETIKADLVESAASVQSKQAFITNLSSEKIPLVPNSLDGVFTDPPYFDNVQYAELMDFCFVWLKEIAPSFANGKKSTKSFEELTGNLSQKKGLIHFTEGLSKVFQNFSFALKPDAPFVFTYHHNDPEAYLPLVVAILNSNLNCSATIPAPGEMSASRHIANSKSSILDSIFVCREKVGTSPLCIDSVIQEFKDLIAGGVRIRNGDIRCVLIGHFTRQVINYLYEKSWDKSAIIERQLDIARTQMENHFTQLGFEEWVGKVENSL